MVEIHNPTAEELSNKDQSNENEVLYSIVCQDHKTQQFRSFASSKNPFSHSSLEDLENLENPKPSSAIEVFIEASGVWTPLYETVTPTTFSTAFTQSHEPGRLQSIENHDDQYHSTQINHTAQVMEDGTPISDLGSFRPSLVTIKAIHIHSSNLIGFLRSFIQYYPGQTFLGNKIVLEAPFKMLAHYYRELDAIKDRKEFISHNASSKYAEEKQGPKSTTYTLDAATRNELDTLLRSFRGEYVRLFAEEESKHASGVTSFDLLWLLFKPGDKVYGRINGKLTGMIFDSSAASDRRLPTLKGGDPSSPKTRRFLQCQCWSLFFDDKAITKMPHSFDIEEFTGDREITSLELFPTAYLDSADGGEMKSKLQTLGERYFNIARVSPAHMSYSGVGWVIDTSLFDQRPSGEPDIEYIGEIILDRSPQTTSRKRRDESPDRSTLSLAARYGVVSATESSEDIDDSYNHELTDLNTKQPTSMLRKINPKKYERLTADHYFLLPGYMTGFALRYKQRMVFIVDDIQPIKWPSRHHDPMSTLILKDSDKDLIKALAQQHSKGKKLWGADHIAGKGEGQIFLLHGPPGTGKTYTVECVSKYTRRPLLRLTVADIGTDEVNMEEILGEWFQRATKWKAIILIDEADVFLEKRQVKDLQRNSLVSVFLSCMEYYSGMLFLTTNRIGQIDDAFLSRTSVALTYETLDAGKQKLIWQGFLKKLSEERKDISLTDRAKKFVEGLDKDETTKDISWNGREIRNALQSAIALATFDAEEEAETAGVRPSKILVRDGHFQAIVDRRKDFFTYRKSIRNQDEEARAYNEGSRGPPPRKS